jgi:hypothetical protein
MRDGGSSMSTPAPVQPNIAVVEMGDGHIYRVDGVIKPSVTQILKDCRIADFDAIPQEVGEYAMTRGSALHLACELLDKELLDESDVDPVLVPYLDAYREWKEDVGFEPSLIEFMFYHPLGYCGTMDRTGRVRNNDKLVVDLKTGEGEIKKHVGLQLVAYAMKLGAPLTFRRFAVRLNKHGKYKAVEFPRENFHRDWAVFQSALNVYNFKRS